MKSNIKIPFFTCLFWALILFSNCAFAQSSDFTFSSTDSCESRAMTFRVTTPVAGAVYNWSFSNTSTNTNLGTGVGTVVSKNFLGSGNYQVSLSVNGGPPRVRPFNVYKNPIVSFKSIIREGCVPYTANFIDSSKAGDGSIAKWEWSYNDGTSEIFTTATNPTHIYKAGGDYTPTLIVTNSVGCVTSLPKDKYIKVYDRIKPVYLVRDNFSCPIPQLVSFENTSSVLDGTFNFIWDFGDGTRQASNSVNLTHNYTKAGVYHIKLIAKNGPGSCADSVIGSGLKDVIIGRPVAILGSIKDTVCLAESVNFSTKPDTTKISNQSNWIFEDDGSKPYGTSVNHTFNKVGKWKVRYVAYNTLSLCYSDTVMKEVVVLPIPTADFSVDIPTGCQIPHQVTFHNTSKNGKTYDWTFGDGTSISQSDTGFISHNYTSFTSFSVTLKTTNAAKCSNSKTFNYIRNARPTVDFTYTPADGCPPLAVSIKATATSNDPILKYVYNFGNGRIDTVNTATYAGVYPTSGNFQLKVSIITAQGCKAESLPKPVTVNDICDDDGGGGGGGGGGFGVGGGGGFDRCLNKYRFVFSDTVANTTVVSWLFDGVPGGNANPRDYTFPSNTGKKKFVVEAVIRNTLTNVQSTFKKRVIVVDEKAKFQPDKNAICRNGTVNFETLDIDSTNISKYIWDYDDSTKIDTLDNIAYFKKNTKYLNGDTKHVYADTGVFHPKLTVIDKFGCIDSIRFNSIRVQGPKAKFGTVTSSFCKGQFGVAFSDSSKRGSISPIVEWKWEYGDLASTISAQDTIVTHKYVDPTRLKTFRAILTVKDGIGCTDTNSFVIRHPLTEQGPKAKFLVDTAKFCKGKFDVLLTDSTVKNGNIPIKEWKWNFGDGTTLTSAQDTAILRYFNNTTRYKKYTVSLTVKDSVGCEDTYTRDIESYNPKASFYTNDTLRCGKFDIFFYNNSSAEISTNNQYTWKYGNGQTSKGFYGSYTYTDTGRFDITLIVTDNGGCVDSATKSNYVKLVKPKASFEIIGDTTLCVTKFTSKFLSTSTFSKSFSWDFGDGEFSNTTQIESNHFYKEADTYQVRLIVTGLDGCKDTTTKQIRIRGPKGKLVVKDSYLCLGDSLATVVRGGKNIKTYSWDFDDASNNAAFNTSDSVFHVYAQPGKYLPNIILTSPENCSLTFTATDSVQVDKLDAGPDANIECGDVYTTIKGKTALNITGNYEWLGPLGGTYLPDKNTLITQVDTPGEYILRTKNNLCKATDTVIVTTSGIVPTANAGVDKKLDCISGTVVLDGSTTTANTRFKWKGPVGVVFVPNDSVAQPSVNKVGSYVLTVIQKFCTKTDTVLVSECTLRPTDTTVAICANVAGLPSTYQGYDLSKLNSKVIGSVSSNVVWFRNNSFSNAVANQTNVELIDSQSYFAKIISLDGTEIGRAEVKPVVHPFVKVSFDDIPNTCTLSDTIQITGISPIGGLFTGTHFTSNGKFIPPSDSGKYAVKYKYTSPDGCPDSLTKIATVIEIPTRPVVSDTIEYCQRLIPLPVLSAIQKPNHTLFWYSDTLLPHTLLTPILDRKVSVVQYFVSQKNSLCESPKSKITVVVDSVPTAPIVTPLDEICEGFSRTVFTSGLPKSSYFWKLNADPALVVHSSSVDSIRFEVGNTDVQGKVVEITNRGCVGDTGTFVVPVIPLPDVNAGIDKKLDCISGTTILLGSSITPNTKFKWTGPVGTTHVANDSVAQPKVDKTGSYVLTVTFKFCEKKDTVKVTECTLRPTDTTLAICANVAGLPSTFQGYDLTQLNNHAIGGVPSTVQWYADSNFTNLISGAYNLVDSVSYFAKITSIDGTEIARSELKNIVHDFVKVAFDDIPNTCTLSDTIQISGISPIGGLFTGTHFTADGKFIPPSDSGKYSVKYKYTSPDGCPDSLTKLATVIEIPTRPIVSDTIEYCQRLNPLPVLSAIQKPNHTLFWYSDTLLPHTLSPSILGRKVGKSQYFVSQKNSLCESPKSKITVLVDSVPIAPIVTTLNKICEGFGRTLNTSGLPKSTYTWLLQGGANLSLIPSIADSLAFTAGTENISGKVVETSNKGCVGDTGFFVIPIDSLPTNALVNGLPQDTNYYCITQATKTLNANTPKIGIGQWNILRNTDFASFDVSKDTTILAGFSEMKDTLVTEWVIKNGVCPESKARLTVLPVQAFTPTVSLKSIPTVCEGTQVQLDAVPGIASGVAPKYRFFDSSHTLLSGTDSSNPFALTASQDSTFYVVMYSDYACLYVDTAKSNLVPLKVIKKPFAKILFNHDTICVTDAPILLTAKETPYPNITYEWYYEGKLKTQTPKPAQLNISEPDSSGTYKLKVYDAYCPPAFDTLKVKLYEKPVLTLPDEMSVMFAPGKMVQIPLEIAPLKKPEDLKSIYWSETSYLGYYKNGLFTNFYNDTLLQRPFYVAQEDELVTVYNINVSTGSKGKGCETSASIVVKNYVPVNIPNAFSPNADGLNDTWIIRGLANYPNTKVKVFNRWGNVLLDDQSGYQNPWDGTNNGVLVPFGTYYYVIDFLGSADKTDYSTSGWLVIVE